MQIAVSADSTLQQIADSINAESSGPVVASVTKKGTPDERIVLSSRTTGSGSDFSVSGGLLNADAAYTTPDVTKLDALYSLDGVTGLTSKTNVLEDAVPGLGITLKGVTAQPAAINVTEPALDREAVKKKITAFVDAYNAVVNTVRSDLTEKPVSSPTGSFDAGLGQLYGDTGLQSLLSTLRRQMTNMDNGAGVNDLADLGIGLPASATGVVSEDARAGRLTIDATKLSAALEADWTQVKDFFTGFSKQVSDFVDTQTGGNGIIDGRLKSADSNKKTLQDQLTQANERIDAKEKRLKAQFAAMETALQNSQTQQAWLTAQLAGLGSSSG